jgi:hypothetical protein
MGAALELGLGLALEVALGATVVPLPVEDLLEELHADATKAPTTTRTPTARARDKTFEPLTTCFPSLSSSESSILLMLRLLGKATG